MRRQAEDVAIPGERLQAKAEGTLDVPESVEQTLGEGAGGGQPISTVLRDEMESAFETDFADVRVHTGGAAAELNRYLSAHAFTLGRDIYFDAGEYRPETPQGRHLLAHELTHVVQQNPGLKRRPKAESGGGAPMPAAGKRIEAALSLAPPEGWVPGTGIQGRVQSAPRQVAAKASTLIQRKNGDKTSTEMLQYQVLVPADYTTLDQMFRLFERFVYGREMNFGWNCRAYCDMERNRGRVVAFRVPKGTVDANTDPGVKEQRSKRKDDYQRLPGGRKGEVTKEANRRYYQSSGDKPGTRIKPGEEGKARMWDQSLSEVMGDKKTLEKLPPAMRQLMGGEGNFKPKDYTQLLRLAEKLKQFQKEDFEVYKLIALKATDNLDLFEKSVDMYLARKEELRKAADALKTQPTDPAATKDKEPTLDEVLAKKFEGLDEASIGKMSEVEQYRLAQQKANELTAAQLEYMAKHPGQTIGDFAKSATLMNTPETFEGIGKDLQEVANGDANTFARWAAGAGAGAKLSGWLLAVAGIVYVASWLTGIGELATIAAAAGILLGTTLTLSAVEADLRVKAASQAKTPEEFKRNVQLAAAAQANVVVGVALIVVAAVLHFTAKALFPKTIQSIKVSLKNLRERIRLKGSVFELKPEIIKDVSAKKAELVKAAETAKQNASKTAAELEALSTEEFVERLEKGDSGFLDQSKVPADQKVDFRELLKSPEGRSAIESYKQKLVKALKTDVPAEIDRLAGEYTSKIDEFLKAVDEAKNHDDLGAAADGLDKALSEERAKEFMKGEQDAITKKKLEEAAGEASRAALTAIKDAVTQRVKARVAVKPDKFKFTYTDAEMEALVKKGKELGLSDKAIEDFVYIGSREAKAISAVDLMDQMGNWATEVKTRGFPYKFKDMPEFQQFGKDLADGVKKAAIPSDDVRVQGSSVRKKTANDVDLAVFVDEATFDKMLVDRFHERMTVKGGAKILLKGKSHAELLKLAREIEANPGNYNATARTFQNAMTEGSISSKSDISKGLKTAAHDIAAKYSDKNIEAISVQIKGGPFDLQPSVPVPQ